jgi:ParB/RepB/Spo0J family partition protein
MFDSLHAWLRTRVIDVPRIDNLRQLELLCEADPDRELWQCLAEGAAIDQGADLRWHGAMPVWKHALQNLQWTRSQFADQHSRKDEVATLDEREDAWDAGEQRITDEVNLFLSRVFAGKEMLDDDPPKPLKPLPNSQPLPFDSGDEPMVATTAKKPAKAKATETDDELLARSLSFHGPFKRLQETGATDDELLIEINTRWRQAPVHGPRPYQVKTNTQAWGTAIWFEADADVETLPALYAAHTVKGIVGTLLPAVRRVLGISQKTETNDAKHETNDSIDETDADRFESLKAKGKSKAKVPHPSTTSATTPAGILANDPEAGSTELNEDRAELGPIEKFPVAKMRRSPYQTRSEPTTEWLQELGRSMQDEGQLQPCLVRPDGELIAGHTRWQAAQLIKWSELDVRIVTCDDATARRLVLIDNAKRKDLTERERCQAYCDLLAEYKSIGRTQAQLAKKLGIDEATLSNILRLQSLPDSLWKRFEAKGLSVDQLRALTVHAARPKFVKAFEDYFKTVCRCDIDEQPENHHFDAAFERGIGAAFRTMSKDSWGGGCQFKPTDEEKKELDIVDVKRRYGGTQKMAANVNLWNKLNQAAKKKAKEKEAAKASATADPKKLKAAARAEAQRHEAERNEALDDCWHAARAQAIVAKFAKPKKQDFAAAVRLRMFMIGEDHWREAVDLDVLISPEADFHLQICDDVRRWFGERNGPQCDVEVLEQFVDWLKIDPVPHWKASTQLLDLCTPAELQEIAQEFDLPEDQTANDLVETLANKWPPGHVPAMFCLEKEPKKPAKKGTK